MRLAIDGCMNANEMMAMLFRPSHGSRRVLQVVRCFTVGPEGGDVAHCKALHSSAAAIRADYPKATIIGCRWLNPVETAMVRAGNEPLFDL